MPLDPPTLDRAVIFVVSLSVLLIAHQVGDHIVQSDQQAARKADPGRYGRRVAARAMAGHLATYHVVAAAVLLGTDAVLHLPVHAAGLTAGLLFSAVTHGLLDLRWPVRMIMRAAGSGQFAQATAPVCGLYVADQALHKLALLGSALLVAAL